MSIIKNYFKQNKVTHTFSSCQWPIGDPQEKDFQFCDAGTAVGKPYCQQHCDVAYIDEKELKSWQINNKVEDLVLNLAKTSETMLE